MNKKRVQMKIPKNSEIFLQTVAARKMICSFYFKETLRVMINMCICVNISWVHEHKLIKVIFKTYFI